jgi:hypothetical protein
VRRPGDDELDRWVRGATWVALVLVGALLGVVEAFLVPLRLLGGVEGLSVLLAVGGNLVMGWAAGRALGRVEAVLAPEIGWFAAVGVLTFFAPGGDVVLPGALGTDPGVATVVTWFELGGVIAAVGAVVAFARWHNPRSAHSPDR